MDHILQPPPIPLQTLGHWPLAAVAYLSCALDSAAKRNEALRRRLEDTQKSIETAKSSKERRRHKRKRCYILHDIQLCHGEMETLVGAVDASRAQMDQHYHQEMERRRHSYAASSLYVPLVAQQPAPNPYVHQSLPVTWQYQPTPWEPFPQYYDPYAAAASQYAIQQAFTSIRPLSYPPARLIDYVYQAISPLSHESWVPETESSHNLPESSAVQDVPDCFAGLSLSPPPLSVIDTSITSRTSSHISNDVAEPMSTTPTSPKELPLEDVPLSPPERRYSAAAIDLLLYRFRINEKKSCHRRFPSSDPVPYRGKRDKFIS